MQIEHIAGIRFTSGRTAKKQRNLAVCPRMFGKIIINDQGIASSFHEFFTNGSSRIGSDILQRRRLICSSNDDNCVVHGTGALQNTKRACNSSLLLSDGHVDTNQVLAFLINDRVNGNGRLAGLTITNNQFALSPPNRNHRVDGLDARLDRRIHILTIHHTRSDTLNWAEAGCGNWPLSINGLTQRVDYTTDHGITHRNRSDTPRSTHGHAFRDSPVIAHNDHTNTISFKVECSPHNTIQELNKFLRSYICKSLYTSNTITRLGHGTNIADIEFRFKSLNLLLQIPRDLLDQVCHEFLHAKIHLRTTTRIRLYPGLCVIFAQSLFVRMSTIGPMIPERTFIV